MEVNEALARKVLDTVNAGLVSGIGVPEPGKMCVEAAVCYAMGLPHSDQPTCVGEAVRAFKIRLNDSRWSSDKARTNGMRKLAIAQLGSNVIDQKAFARIVAEQCIRQIVPIALRAAASVNPKHSDNLEAAAVRCEQEGTSESARAARAVARDAAAAAAADAADAADAYAAAAAAAVAADAADAYAAAASRSLTAASGAGKNAKAKGGNNAISPEAAATAKLEPDAIRDGVLNRVAEIGLSALVELKSPGCAFLYLAEAA
jgi:hypothetical protein